ncbi:MFS general substrate transporter [Echria macrotheca]|uniref:MFS general substrate transporter n=1 Tax=Echria macrotheca TaxID=438768 RepID=A0AAJ0F3K0_9PEZI|nr:MFS general substrate transporter [Echria macrotheca]
MSSMDSKQEKARDQSDVDLEPAFPETQLEQAPPGQSLTPEIPDGGLRAWMVVLGCWCVSFVSFGIISSFGVYETYYLETYLRDYSPSAIAWIGSIQTFAQFSATLLSGPATDRYGPMVLIWPFSVLLVVAFMLTSLCTEYYQFFLCQGILLGFSCGLIFAPAFAVIGHYFFKRRAMAMAYASTGSPIGGIVYPVILTSLIHNDSVGGFPWAQRICGFLTLGLLLVAAVTIRPTSFKRKGAFILLGAFKNSTYTLQIAGLFMSNLGFWTPYFYLGTYAQEHGTSAALASYLFAILGAGSFVGRLLGGTFALHLGQLNIVALACYASSILVFCWLRITSTGGLVALAVLFGATSGIIIAMMVSTIAHCAPHPSQIGAYIGQATIIIGFASLAGTPITGALIKDGDYTGAIVFSAATQMVGAVLFSFARYAAAKDKLIA